MPCVRTVTDALYGYGIQQADEGFKGGSRHQPAWLAMVVKSPVHRVPFFTMRIMRPDETP
jgi:hypothetical protein